MATDYLGTKKLWICQRIIGEVKYNQN